MVPLKQNTDSNYLQVCEEDTEINVFDEAKLNEAIDRSRHQPTALLQPTKELKEKYR